MPRNLYDNANSVPLWSTTTIKLAPTQDNANLFFANTTANAFVQNETVGIFGVSPSESANTSGLNNRAAHAGWVVRTTGIGGRAGRTQWETMIATSGIVGDFANDDVILPE